MSKFNFIYAEDLSHREKTVYIYLRDRAETNDAKLGLTMSIGWRHHGASRRTYSTGGYTSTEKGQEYKQCSS